MNDEPQSGKVHTEPDTILGGSLPKASIWVLPAMLLISSMAQADLVITPFVMSSIIAKFHVAENLGVFAMSAQLGAFALAAFASSAGLEKLRVDVVGRLAIVSVVLSQLFSFFAPSFIMVVLARTVAGVGEGLCVALAYAYLSQRRDSSRLLSVQAIMQGVGCIVLSLLVPPAIARFGQAGVYVPPGVMAALAVPLSLALPGYHLVRERHAEPAIKHVGGSFLAVLLAVICAIMISASSNLLWLFTNELGSRDGMTLSQVSWMIAVSNVLTLVGPYLAHVTSRRFGEFWPMMFICLVMAVTGWYIAMTRNTIFFIFVNYAENLGYVWGAVLIRIACAESDRSGRSAAAVGGGDAAGWVFGPFCAGVVATIWPGYLGIAGIAVLTCIVAAVAIWWRRMLGIGAVTEPESVEPPAEIMVLGRTLDPLGDGSSKSAAS